MATQPGRATTDVDYRITLGAYVNARLQVNPKAFRIPCNNLLDIYIVRDFLDERERHAHWSPAPVGRGNLERRVDRTEHGRAQADREALRSVLRERQRVDPRLRCRVVTATGHRPRRGRRRRRCGRRGRPANPRWGKRS